jgi:hypothetical protein
VGWRIGKPLDRPAEEFGRLKIWSHGWNYFMGQTCSPEVLKQTDFVDFHKQG